MKSVVLLTGINTPTITREDILLTSVQQLLTTRATTKCYTCSNCLSVSSHIIVGRQRIKTMYVYDNTESRSCNHCCGGKAVSITYCECVFVALCIQHAMRIRRIIFATVACPSVPYISTLSHKQHDFGKMLLNTKCVFWFPLTNFVWNIFYSKKKWTRYDHKWASMIINERDMIINERVWS